MAPVQEQILEELPDREVSMIDLVSKYGSSWKPA
jgi:hypothetical protein